MKTLSKPLAIAIMAVLIVGSSLFSGIRQVNALADECNAVFTQGVNGDGLSIARDLRKRADCTENIIAIANTYIDTSDEDVTRALQLADLLRKETDKKKLYEAHIELQSRVEGILSKLAENTSYIVNTKNKEAIREQKSIFDSAYMTIGYDGYNQKVEEFNRKTDGFVGAFFKLLSKKVQAFE
ncbi:MAG: hypothetical protein HUJ58_06560 [Erysipelotrichaceae bacterium]|nr:hypothetical protein [Erysipelotrichaceae bacterium]